MRIDSEIRLQSHHRAGKGDGCASAGVGCFWIFVILALVPSCYQWAQKSLNTMNVERELRKFASEHAAVLQRTIDEVEGEITKRKQSLDALERDLTRLNRDFHRDAEYQSWSWKIKEMTGNLNSLKHEREEVFIAYKKYELSNPGSREYQARLEKAVQATTETRQAFEKMRSEFESAQQTQ